MPQFPEPPDDDYASIYLEETDRPLPEKIFQNTRYAYFKTIARSGKAIISSCKDRHLGRVICHKKLRPEIADDPVEQMRLLREARVTASLQHPNTVPIYEVGRDQKGRIYFTMKLVHGFTLRELFDEKYRDRYDLVQLVDVLIQVAHALRYAHSHRVIHRDIKPENVLIGPFGEVLVLDWGLAKVWREDKTDAEPPADAEAIEAAAEDEVSGLTGAGQLDGTIEYMSPEQLRADPDIDYRTDIYSFGVMLYEVMARRIPFLGETISQMKEQILTVTPPRPSSLTTEPVPPPLEDLALRCLHKDREERIPGCDEIIRTLQHGWAR